MSFTSRISTSSLSAENRLSLSVGVEILARMSRLTPGSFGTSFFQSVCVEDSVVIAVAWAYVCLVCDGWNVTQKKVKLTIMQSSLCYGHITRTVHGQVAQLGKDSISTGPA